MHPATRRPEEKSHSDSQLERWKYASAQTAAARSELGFPNTRFRVPFFEVLSNIFLDSDFRVPKTFCVAVALIALEMHLGTTYGSSHNYAGASREVLPSSLRMFMTRSNVFAFPQRTSTDLSFGRFLETSFGNMSEYAPSLSSV